MKLLLDQKEVNPDSRDCDGRTPLMQAAGSGRERIVKLLLDRKDVSPDSKDNCGGAPLLLAAWGGHKGTVKLLQGRADAEPCTGANDASTPPFHLLQNSYEGLAVSQLSPSPPGVAPDMPASDGHDQIMIEFCSTMICSISLNHRVPRSRS